MSGSQIRILALSVPPHSDLGLLIFDYHSTLLQLYL